MKTEYVFGLIGLAIVAAFFFLRKGKADTVLTPKQPKTPNDNVKKEPVRMGRSPNRGPVMVADPVGSLGDKQTKPEPISKPVIKERISIQPVKTPTDNGDYSTQTGGTTKSIDEVIGVRPGSNLRLL